MAIKDDALQAIETYIKANGKREITGPVLANVLRLVLEASVNTETIARAIEDGTAFYGVPENVGLLDMNNYVLLKDAGGKGMFVNLGDLTDLLKQYIEITSIEMEPLVGGGTSGTALEVPEGPVGELRTAEVSSGKWYDFGSGPVEASAGRRWKAYWNGTSWSLKDMGALPTTPTSNQVTSDGLMAVSQKGVFNNTVLKRNVETTPISVNEFRQDLIQNGNLNSSGVFVEGAGKAVIGQQVTAGQQYALSGIPVDANKRIAFKDANGALVDTVMNMSVMPRGITAPATAVTVDYDIKTISDADDTVFANFQFEKGTTPSAYVAPDNQINKISGNKINASSLVEGNNTPKATELKNAVPLGQMYNEYQGKVYEGTLKTGSTMAQQRNLLNEVIVDIKITGAKSGKEYMLRTICFKDPTAKDYTTFSEGTVTGGVFTEEKILVAVPSGTVNSAIPDTLTGKAYSKYDLGDGTIAEVWFDFNRKVGWTLTVFALAADSANVAAGCYINRKKATVAVGREFVRRNYQGSILSGVLQTSSNANAINLINSVIEDEDNRGARK